MATILIIEDEASIRALLERILAHLRHASVSASTGAEGLEKLRNQPVDVVLSDLRLPGEPTGMDLVAALRAEAPQIPLIMVSGYATQEIMAQCARLGVHSFLAKPFDLKDVRELINLALQGAGIPPGPP